MRIALISPLYESVPPAGYGGTERVVHWLAEALVRQYLYFDGEPSYLDQAREHAARALSIDPRCSSAHTALGFAHHLDVRSRAQHARQGLAHEGGIVDHQHADPPLAHAGLLSGFW